MNLIAHKILKTCHFNKIKNKNNNNSLKSGTGKLMITNGLSVLDFERKFKFNV